MQTRNRTRSYAHIRALYACKRSQISEIQSRSEAVELWHVMADGGKPRVLVLGGKMREARLSEDFHFVASIRRTGVGFVGRHLVAFLLHNQLVSKLRVADKVPPATGWLNDEHKVSSRVMNIAAS